MVAFYIMLARPVGRVFSSADEFSSDANRWGYLWTV